MAEIAGGFTRMTFRRTRCAHCKKRLNPERPSQIVHLECVVDWQAAEKAKESRKAEKQARMAAKVERATTRARKQAANTIPDLIKEAQVAFNAFIRERDKDSPCICCGRPLGAGDVGGGFDCGHYRSVGSASHLRFDERNAHGQTKYCNRHGAGRAVDYRLGLIDRIGLASVESLESDNHVHRWTREELIGIRDKYRAKLRDMRKREK